jgi:hypothetical protein
MERHMQALRAIDEKLHLFRDNLQQDGSTLSDDRKAWLRESIENLQHSKMKLVLDQQNTGGQG